MWYVFKMNENAFTANKCRNLAIKRWTCHFVRAQVFSLHYRLQWACFALHIFSKTSFHFIHSDFQNILLRFCLFLHLSLLVTRLMKCTLCLTPIISLYIMIIITVKYYSILADYNPPHSITGVFWQIPGNLIMKVKFGQSSSTFNVVTQTKWRSCDSWWHL